MSKALEQAKAFYSKAKELEFDIEVTPCVVKIHRSFPAGDTAIFSFLDSIAGEILDLAPLKGGSIWGTDGGSVGGHIALKSGMFTMNKSGNGANFIKQLKKLIESEAK